MVECACWQWVQRVKSGNDKFTVLRRDVCDWSVFTGVWFCVFEREGIYAVISPIEHSVQVK